ncbi:hypothetical protein OROGR_013653 [Orobanche gracilis]
MFGEGVKLSTTLWAMRLRLIRSFDVPAYNNKNEVASFEFIFQDKEDYFMSTSPCGNRERKNDGIHTRSRGLCGTYYFSLLLETMFSKQRPWQEQVQVNWC